MDGRLGKDILTGELASLRERTEARTRKPDPARAAELMLDRDFTA